MLNDGQVSQLDLQVKHPSLIESFKNALQPEAIANRLGIDKNTFIDVAIYGAIGFIFGFLLKKYSEYFIALVFFVIAIIVLQQFDYVSVSFNTVKIHEMFGLTMVTINSGYGALLLEWAKSNVPALASLIIGFLVGLKCA